MDFNFRNGPLVVVALDPGGTTGWASYRTNYFEASQKMPEFVGNDFDAGQLGPAEHHRRLYSFLAIQQTHNFIVVCESFQYRPNMDSAELISNEYIGVVKMFEQDMRGSASPVPVVWQTKSYGRGFFDDDKLKKLGRYTKGMKHANDAMGHLLQFLVFSSFDRRDILGGLR